MAVPAVLGERLPLPDTLPAPWQAPDDERHHWVWDRVHAPHQLTVLDYDFYSRFVDRGIRFACHAYSMPFDYRSRRFWTRYYTHTDYGGVDPNDMPPNLVLDTVAADLGVRWHESWLPELETFADYLFGLDLAAATDDELALHLDGAVRRVRRAWELHFESTFAAGRVWDWFFKLLGELFEGSTPGDAATLLVGLPNQTTAAGHALWRLRDVTASSPAVLAALDAHGSSADEVLAALSAEPQAAPFLAALRTYLHDYCRRPPYMTLCAKTWFEDPTEVLAQLRDALAHPELDPERHRQALAVEREEATAAARAAIHNHPQPVHAEFERVLALAYDAMQYKEDHNFYIDFQLTAALRRVLVEVGRRLVAAGAVEEEDDFHHLTIDESREALVTRPRPDLRSVVAERQAEMMRFQGADAPTEIGTKPAPSTSDAPESSPPVEPEAGVLSGQAVSAGTGRGRARVVTDMQGARHLRPGEVLVAPSTAQPWTPLFAIAAGLVTETGGVLSHAAIVAREYRLPAVGRVKGALTRLRTGMLVEVNGTTGTVRIIDEN